MPKEVNLIFLDGCVKFRKLCVKDKYRYWAEWVEKDLSDFWGNRYTGLMIIHAVQWFHFRTCPEVNPFCYWRLHIHPHSHNHSCKDLPFPWHLLVAQNWSKILPRNLLFLQYLPLTCDNPCYISIAEWKSKIRSWKFLKKSFHAHALVSLLSTIALL